MSDEDLRHWAVEQATAAGARMYDVTEVASQLLGFVRPHGPAPAPVPPVTGSSAGDYFEAELARQARELDEEPQGA